MVVLPVFLQAPWVRLDPFSATLFTGVLVAAGLVMHQSRSQTTSDLGSLLVGFSGSWLAGCIFWGWLRAHPVLHLPVEAFAVPVALGGLQGRWRLAATLFTAVLIAAGLLLHQSRSQTASDLGSLLVGFSGSWLAGCIFWGWLRAHPVLHLPVEAFAVPVALGGLQGRWRLAATFYLSSLLGTACTDLAMAATGVMQFWPAVVTASLDQAPLLLHQAGLHLLQPLPMVTLMIAAAIVLFVGRRLNTNGNDSNGETGAMAAAVLITTLWVDGLFLLSALLQPGLSGLIE